MKRMSDPVVFLPLTQGQVAIIDFADFEKVGRFKWYAYRRPSGNFHAVRNSPRRSKRTQLFLHCEILGIKGIDHKNGNGLDCRRENMRPATSQQNGKAFQRKTPGTSSIYRGVTWYESCLKWGAQIRSKRTKFHLGCFKIEEDAARAYDKKAKELGFFREALNFP